MIVYINYDYNEIGSIKSNTRIEFADDFNGYDISTLNNAFSISNNVTFSVDFSNFDASNVTDFYRMAYYSRHLSGEIKFSPSAKNTVATTFKDAFYWCVEITQIDLSGFYLDASTLNTMENCFQGCQSVIKIDMPNIDISDESINVDYMFSTCSRLNILYIQDAS